MDGKRFDEISRLLSRSVGRRGAVKGVLAAILGGGAIVAGLDGAEASKPLRGRPYRSSCTADRQCRNPLVCRRAKSLPRLDRNRCGCPDGLFYCDGQCIEFGTDEHCLFCGDACGADEKCCADGSGCTEIGTVDACTDCGDVCDPVTSDVCIEEDGAFFCACGVNGEICDGENEACCDGVCADLLMDRSNCGACGDVCDVACYGGVCHGIFGLRTAGLDTDGNGYTLCNVYLGPQDDPILCDANVDCEDFIQECSGPDFCVCLEETTYRQNGLDDVAPFGGQCAAIRVVNENLLCNPV